MKKRYYTLLIFSYIIIATVHSQNLQQQNYKTIKSKIDSILNNVDFLTYEYNYLDDEFKITIPPDIFNETVKIYNFHKDQITKYEDSLGVVLMAEFHDWDEARIAEIKITYSWNRIGYYIWKTPLEAKKLAHRFNIVYPAKLYDFIIDEDNNDTVIVDLIDQLKSIAKPLSNTPNFESLSRQQLLSECLRFNPQRIESFKKNQAIRKKQREAYQKEHGEVDPSKLGVGCGKENCCQKQGK